MTITNIIDIVAVGKKVHIKFASDCGSGTIQVKDWALLEIIEGCDNDDDILGLVQYWMDE
jgi:hypothetical protein